MKYTHTSGQRRWLTTAASLACLMLASTAIQAQDAPAKKAVRQENVQVVSDLIDRHVAETLKEEDLKALALADDAEFLRRAYLDIVGVIPSIEKTRAFLNSKNPNKRAELINELLENPRFGQYLGESWTNLLIPRISNNRRLNSKPLEDWFAKHLNSNTPMDKLAYEFITASGPVTENGAVTFFIANTSVDKVLDNTAQMFLGLKIQCAQCHDHPFVDYKQKDYWGMATFFTNVTVNGNPNQAAKKGIVLQVGEITQADLAKQRGKNRNKRARVRKLQVPREAIRVSAKFLKGDEPKLEKNEAYRPTLAKWVVSKDNAYFARAMVNRVWYQMFGRGIINPVDDMHAANPASHPELLEELTEEFKNSGFDLKFLYRAIANSKTYQRTSKQTGDEADGKDLYSHTVVRNLSPEQFFDSLYEVIGKQTANQAAKMRMKNRKAAITARDRFVDFFRVDNANPLEYQSGIPQALMLMNNRQLNNTNGVLADAVKAGKNPEGVIEYLYLAALSRRPNSDELQRLTKYVADQDNARQGYSDILWALLNSSEFALNH